MKVYNYISFYWDEAKQEYVKDYTEYEDYEGPVALCGSGGGGDTKVEVRYAEYIEGYHHMFLDAIHNFREEITGGLNNPWNFLPYTNIICDDAFFGAGYLISSFPSLYDMFGKFMAGLDIEVLWSQVFEDTVNSPVVDTLVAAEAALMDADIEANILPRFQTGMRDMNSVMASTYIIGKAMIEDARVKARSKYQAELHYKLIPAAVERWKVHLDWNKNVTTVYAELMKFYFMARIDVDEANYSQIAKGNLWQFTCFEFERAALGAMQAAQNTRTGTAGESGVKGILSGALSGAGMGAVGGPWGALAGGVLGGLGGALS